MFCLLSFSENLFFSERSRRGSFLLRDLSTTFWGPVLFRFENVPLIFTEYYKEDCELNLEKVDSLVEPELTVMVEPGENPFCSSLPARKSPDLDIFPSKISVFFDNFSNDDIKKSWSYQINLTDVSSEYSIRIPTGFAFRQFKRRNVVMSNDFICVVKWVKDWSRWSTGPRESKVYDSDGELIF